jgi:hypothetical protein
MINPRLSPDLPCGCIRRVSTAGRRERQFLDPDNVKKRAMLDPRQNAGGRVGLDANVHPLAEHEHHVGMADVVGLSIGHVDAQWDERANAQQFG